MAKKKDLRSGRRFSRGFVTLLLALMIPQPAFTQTPTPTGAQFLVNTYTTSDQIGPSIAMDEGGAFVIVWDNRQTKKGVGFGTDVKGQRFAVGGQPKVTS